MAKLGLALLLFITPSECFSFGQACARTAVPTRLSPAGIAAAARKPPTKKSAGVDFSRTGSKDADGYTRGSFGIGENESSEWPHGFNPQTAANTRHPRRDCC